MTPEQPDEVEAASRRLIPQRETTHRDDLAKFFNEFAPIEFHRGNLPHWRQEGVTYFVTFRLADSLPQEKLDQWREEREIWLKHNPLPLSPKDEAEYHERFSGRLEQWLDQGSGSCVLALPECRAIVENALRHFDGQRYTLGESVVAPNHVHAILAPKSGHELSDILHSWKSFTSKEIIKVDAARQRLQPFWDTIVEAASRRLSVSPSAEAPPSRRLSDSTMPVEAASCRLSSNPKTSPSKYPSPPKPSRVVWQKESYDHIIRNSEAMTRIKQYVRDHEIHPLSNPVDLEQLRRDAAATSEVAAASRR
jgi:REP element-mobilizing transposase RayT